MNDLAHSAGPCRRLFILSLLLAAAGLRPAAAQHLDDVTLSVPVTAGPIVTSGGDWTGTFAGRVFEGVMPATPPLVTDAPGFTSGSGTFPTVPTPAEIRFDFVKQLLYWNGTALATAPVPLTASFGANSAQVTAADTAGAPGFVIGPVTAQGAFHDHMDFLLPSAAASGLYGVTMTVGPAAGSTGFTTSEPFLFTFAVGSLGPVEYEAGMEALVDAALVPEPGLACVAAGAAAGGAFVLVRRLRRRART